MRRIGAHLFLALACASGVLALPLTGNADTIANQRAALQQQLDQIEKDIANNQGTLSELQKARTTLERDISILDTKIKTAKLQIKQTDLALRQLKGDISTKQSAISTVDAKVDRSKESLAQILKRTQEIDDVSLATTVLSSGTLADVFRELDNFGTLQDSLHRSFDDLAALRDELSDRKQALENKQDETAKVREAQIVARQLVERDEAQRRQILTAAKGQEKTYQQMIAEKQKQAAAIREALFGLRDTGAIQFGTAYGYAKEASAATGVRPALILAILTQESDLGKNVGSCLVTDLTTGDGVGKNSGTPIRHVMKAPRDTDPFERITAAVGRNWLTSPVSCPQSVGYGGAMGPAQFIPSTWVLYQDRLSQLTGESTPNPWNARTAVFATALLMKDNGADGGTREAERRAALKYFAGANWAKPANSVYGSSVLDHADEIQSQIDILGG